MPIVEDVFATVLFLMAVYMICSLFISEEIINSVLFNVFFMTRPVMINNQIVLAKRKFLDVLVLNNDGVFVKLDSLKILDQYTMRTFYYKEEAIRELRVLKNKPTKPRSMI